jgi:hypothetical protein
VTFAGFTVGQKAWRNRQPPSRRRGKAIARFSPASREFGPAGRLFQARMMRPCPLFAVVETITAIGPSMLDKGGVLYRHIEICEQGGRVRRLTIVRAIEALAALIERHAIGMFLFCERQGERLLWCVDRGDGPQQVDFEAMRAYVQQRGHADAP